MTAMPAHDTTVLCASDLKFSYSGTRLLLDIPSLALRAGETLFLYGPSASGKSTLLNLLAGTLPVRQGSVSLAGYDLGQVRAAQRDRIRGDHLGLLFQQFNLLPFMSVLENVLLPCHFSPRRRAMAISRHGSLAQAARTLLHGLGLHDEALLRRRAGQLSVGQQQRVGAARALIGEPEVVMADEPTSALDANTQERFLELLFAECARTQAALLFVSHDQRLAPLFQRVQALPELNRAYLEPAIA